jgi:small subunit ribosomal protein S17
LIPMTGTVTSNKMTKALVVTVFTTKLHPKYKKRFKTKKKYHVACEDSSKFTIGQSVEIVPTRPVSKTITHKVLDS